MDAARDFAEKAIKLTDQNNREYSAIMVTVEVPEYENGTLVMKTKYTYGNIQAGTHSDVIASTILGLLVPNTGQKYLLHTHPDCSVHRWPDRFSGTPNDKDDLGDASVPTLIGRDSDLTSLLNKIVRLSSFGSFGVSGYDGIYLASPTGNLYLYEGLGEGKYRANNDEEFDKMMKKMMRNPIANDFPSVTRYWDENTNTYLPIQWE